MVGVHGAPRTVRGWVWRDGGYGGVFCVRMGGSAGGKTVRRDRNCAAVKRPRAANLLLEHLHSSSRGQDGRFRSAARGGWGLSGSPSAQMLTHPHPNGMGRGVRSAGGGGGCPSAGVPAADRPYPGAPAATKDYPQPPRHPFSLDWMAAI